MPEQLVSFFGDGDELNMLFNFVLNNYLFLALAREQSEPVAQALAQLPAKPDVCQWTNFLRNLDELDLERLPEEDRKEVFNKFAPEEDMLIYGRGIRRRLAPMLNGDRRRLELAFSLLFSMPGTPMIVYGDEIGIGEDLSRHGRNAVRVPMQWSDGENAGFSSAGKSKLIQPVVADGRFGYRKVNVTAQDGDPDSLLNRVKRLIKMRRTCPELGYGTWRLFKLDSPSVLAHRCTWKNGTVIAVHNLSGKGQSIDLDLRDQRGRQLSTLFGEAKLQLIKDGIYEINLAPYDYNWYRVVGERD